MLPLNALVHHWAARPGLRSRAVSWSWFEKAFQSALDAAHGPQGACRADLPALSKAFFAWAEAVDSHTSYEALDDVDFRHFMCGLLLQQLLAPQAPVAACAPPGMPDTAVTQFVLTLLQALRLDAGAQPFEMNPDCSDEAWVFSFLENVREDSSLAIAFLDQMTGLPPVWRGPALIESRPAIQKALARSA